jgi:tripartite-type tricarboxylate transporter receptor subunit TctC
MRSNMEKLMFKTLRRLSFLLFFLICKLSYSANYPDRPITLVVPSTPGGGTDTTSRIIAPKLAEYLGQQIVIVNRPGASGNIGAASVASASPDGYTLLTLISSNVINPHLYEKIPFDIEKDFTPISKTVIVPGILIANKKFPPNNLQELIPYLKENSSKINFGSAGIGSFSHLMMEFFQLNAGVKLLHVPYKSTSQAFTDVLSNQISLMIVDVALAQPYIKNGSLKAYGVSSSKRSSVTPEIPTLSEAGLKNFDVSQWFGLVGPAKLTPEITEKLYLALKKTLEDPDVKETFLKEGMIPSPSSSPSEFRQYIVNEGIKWSEIIRDANLKKGN